MSKQDASLYAKCLKARQDAIDKCIADLKSIKNYLPHLTDVGQRGVLARLSVETAALRNSIPYHWEPEVLRLAILSGAKLPQDTVFDQTWLHSKAGWWWFGDKSPILGRDTQGTDGPHTRVRVHALLYDLVPDVDVGILAFTYDHAEPTRGPVPIGGVRWKIGQTMSSVRKQIRSETAEITKYTIGERPKMSQDLDEAFEEDFDYTSEKILSAFVAGSLWMQQKIVVTSKLDLPKAITRGFPKQEIKHHESYVVSLRKRDYQPKPDSTGKQVDWQFQWIVGAKEGGFWRRQPTKDGIKLIWIEPFIKGPADKPMKPVQDKLYHVNR